MKNVSEMNNGSLYSIILCFLNIVPPLAFPLKFFLSCLEVVLEGGDMKKNDFFAEVIVYL